MSRIQTTIDDLSLEKTQHRKIMLQVMRATGMRHGGPGTRARIRRHFNRNRFSTPGGPYGYRRRTAVTRKRKTRKGQDPNRPNVATGELMRSVISSSTVRATSTRWTWRAKANFSVNSQTRRRRAMPQWQRDELEAIAKSEIADDVKFMGQKYRTLARQGFGRRPKRRRKVG